MAEYCISVRMSNYNWETIDLCIESVAGCWMNEMESVGYRCRQNYLVVPESWTVTAKNLQYTYKAKYKSIWFVWPQWLRRVRNFISKNSLWMTWALVLWCFLCKFCLSQFVCCILVHFALLTIDWSPHQVPFAKPVLSFCATTVCEVHHAKTGPKIFVVVIPKEGFADTSPSKSSFRMTPTIKHNLWRQQNTIL